MSGYGPAAFSRLSGLSDGPVQSFRPLPESPHRQWELTDALLSDVVAAGDLVRTGRTREAEAALRSGLSVRALLRKLYGVTAAPEWDAAAERRAFLRTLRVARLRAVN